MSGSLLEAAFAHDVWATSRVIRKSGSTIGTGDGVPSERVGSGVRESHAGRVLPRARRTA